MCRRRWFDWKRGRAAQRGLTGLLVVRALEPPQRPRSASAEATAWVCAMDDVDQNVREPTVALGGGRAALRQALRSRSPALAARRWPRFHHQAPHRTGAASRPSLPPGAERCQGTIRAACYRGAIAGQHLGPGRVGKQPATPTAVRRAAHAVQGRPGPIFDPAEPRPHTAARTVAMAAGVRGARSAGDTSARRHGGEGGDEHAWACP